MEAKYIDQAVQNLLGRFDFLGAEKFNLDSELNEIIHPITRAKADKESLSEIERMFLDRIKFKRSHEGAILVPVSVVSDPKLHEEWYNEWHSANNNETYSYYWKRLEEFLSIELTRKYGAEEAGRVVRSIDEATHKIMEKIANPLRREFTYKGLVVGYVQSGKTANFTALISKAVDAGYKFVIVLSGIHSVLRRQTQIRLDKELTGMNDTSIKEPFIPEPSDPKRWNRITTGRVHKTKSANGQVKVKDLGEFTTANTDPFDSLCNRTTPTIAVIKKNVKVLNKLIEYISNSDSSSRANMPVLVIDDEADQASVDGNANDPDSDPTTTNDRIRRILALFPRNVYIGYTATPFANVLIDMDTDDDLYPRNFIVSLPEPKGYFGTKKVFRDKLSNLFIEIINDREYEIKSLLKQAQITVNLVGAIDQFLLSCAIRNLRGDHKKPMSMLVHISHEIRGMQVCYEIIAKYIDDIVGRYETKSQNTSLKREFKAVFDKFCVNAKLISKELTLNHLYPAFDDVWNEMAKVLSVLRVIELNSTSDDRLDYNSDEEIKVIAIGGNQLSRGLTLEGLMTSYYLRESKQYDTLLQMGRWFGYRHGYEDLTRLHTTERIWSFFEHLALVEDELRSEIYRYEDEALTPIQMAVAIKSHQNLTVTAPNKMGAAKIRIKSYSSSLNQTIWLPLNQPDILHSNLELGKSFIGMLKAKFGFRKVKDTGVYLTKSKVSGLTVFNDFLIKYKTVDRSTTGGPGLDYDSLLDYISRRIHDASPELLDWSVALVGNVNANSSQDPIDFGGLTINRIRRSRKYTERGFNIGVLTEPAHLEIDGEKPKTRVHPLLLLYVVWKDSTPLQKEKDTPLYDERISLFRFIDSERVDVLGIAIAFPESDSEPNNYIGQ